MGVHFPPVIDDDLWWLLCGDEGSAHFVGPHFSAEDAEADRRQSMCQHDHAVLRMTLRQMATKLPPTARWWIDGIRDAAHTPLRCLVRQPLYPLASATAWHAYAAALMDLRRTTCV